MNVNTGFPIVILKKEEFLEYMPSGWKKTCDRWRNDDNQFTTLLQYRNHVSKEFDGRDNYFELDSREDLEAAKDLILRKPIFTTADCVSTVSSDSSNNDVSRVPVCEDHYVVLVNTGNVLVSSLFLRAFELAERYLREGKNFRIAVIFSDSIEKKQNILNQETRGCNIYLTHGTRLPTSADIMECRQTSNETNYFVYLMPFCLFFGVPEWFSENYIIKLQKESFSEEPPVTKHKGPFQRGFNLMSLLYFEPQE